MSRFTLVARADAEGDARSAALRAAQRSRRAVRLAALSDRPSSARARRAWAAMAAAPVEFAALPTREQNALARGGYWRRTQVAAVPDTWLVATVPQLGVIGLARVRAVIPAAAHG